MTEYVVVTEELKEVFWLADKNEHYREYMEVFDDDEEFAITTWNDQPKYDLDPELIKKYRESLTVFLGTKRQLKREIQKIDKERETNENSN